jgi:hypothetical protein
MLGFGSMLAMVARRPYEGVVLHWALPLLAQRTRRSLETGPESAQNDPLAESEFSA